MSARATKEATATDVSSSDPIVSDTITSALEQLQLDVMEEQPGKVVAEQMHVNNNPSSSTLPLNPSPSNPFPPPHMMNVGFVPYSQMMQHPPQHGPGLFPHPDLQDSSLSHVGPIMFNNSNDSSLFPSGSLASIPSFIPESHMIPNDPLWSATNQPGASSIAIEESGTLGDGLPKPKGPGAATISSRRQTFHAISTHDLIDATNEKTAVVNPPPTLENETAVPVSVPSTTSSNPKTRTQSISFEKTVGHPQFFPATTKVKGIEAKTSDKGINKFGTVDNTYAAYPYGGPLAQPNPMLHKHHAPMGSTPPFPSAFPGNYDFNAPFHSFSPVMGNMNPHALHPQSHIPMPHSPILMHGPMMDGKHKGEPMLNSNNPMNSPLPPHQHFPMMQHTPNGTPPPPWLYGTPPPFNHMGPPPPHGMHVPGGRGHLVSGGRGNNRGGKHTSGRNRNSKHGFNNHHHHHHNNNTNVDANNQRKLEEMSRYADATLDQFAGNIYSLCKDQHGCRFLQKQLDILGTEAADKIFEETKYHTIELMTDSFGNYLIQKLIERVSTEQRTELAKIASPQFVEIALDPHGTRALQKLIECIDTDDEAKIIVASLSGSIVQLSKDLNGNHVVQKCLQKLHPKDFQFIFDATCQNSVDIATHRHGCCVLQRCFDHGTKEQCETLCDELLKHVDKLTLDPFGNYVVQYIITKETEKDKFDYTHKIVHLLKPKIAELSVHKFGSNVIEKLLRTPVATENMILELLNHKADIPNLLNDSYGNYVLQTALDISYEHNTYLYNKLSSIVAPLLVGPIRNTPHGKRIMNILHIE
ncbi:Puf4p NDAI_0D03530 [Naumovozyma dairenensis CBS 421]|uniref:PUM-HD domain-containing protein n=1 Tax=Naumovozyma dairenensis (strain ATCC 10597 / BCRC 20456 / CBS 421 / NBRC 0211 / NRRL Y-12639) TaxID=1071378 RepID=G0WA56_NAUDC|nr:hypothetical protein NDAI_0D03530 [Naumovozyma dairenensis CBS 421]CCD24667.1 hypothetical protein NDAI_0D03530 [Naumovozyma dairenensis CBS 421]